MVSLYFLRLLVCFSKYLCICKFERKNILILVLNVFRVLISGSLNGFIFSVLVERFMLVEILIFVFVIVCIFK